ncbi:hypothetical protein ACLKMH_15510 [Psychromonas sp. KJ10-10]|uniref:hypothetical protein n=1 Tax=Psychromonas sp. KJ10-10 TaxID=3391823 RepID=UPI0039B60EDA
MINKKLIYTMVTTATLFVTVAKAENAEITLMKNLDGFLGGYCLDIKGGNADIDTSNGLQVHTCYSYKGALGKDQIFETTRFENNALFMPEFNVCAQLTGLEAGSTVSLAPCDGSELQNLAFTGAGTISPVKAN